MDQTQRLDWEDEEAETPGERHRPVGNLHMFAGTHGPAQDFPIYPGPNIIGRHSSCDITLPAQSVSKKHAILNVIGGCHTICDNGSLNKTRRSKVALEPEVRYALSNGDFLLFADVACRYTIVKKIQVATVIADESEDDSMLVPGTQAALAIEKTPGAAIRRMGRGAVLARDSGDEDEDVQRGWNNGGEGGSKDTLKISRPAAGAAFSPAADTVVPESDEEKDTSSSETHFPSLHLHCDSDTDKHETPTSENSLIPSSQKIFTPPDAKEPAKEESNRFLQINKEEKPAGEQADEDKTTSSAVKEAASDSGILEERKETREDGTDDKMLCGVEGGVQTDTVDSGLQDGGNNAINCNNSCENLTNNAENIETPEVSSNSNHSIKDNDEISRKDIAATTAIESNLDSQTQAKEDNLKPAEKDLKVEANLCLDSDTDSDEEIPTTSGTDIKKMVNLETKPDKASEETDVGTLGTSDAGVDIDRDTNINEDKEKTSAVQPGQVGEINIDSDTDAEDDTEVSKTENSSEVPKVDTISGTNASTGSDINSDTDVEDADIIRSEEKKVDQESQKYVEEKKEHFHLDSDTDVENDDDVSSTKVRKGEFDSIATDVPIKESKDGIHLDSNTEVEEDVNVSSSDVTEVKQALNVDVQEGFHADSDTDVEDVDVSSTMVTKEKQDSGNSVQDTKEGLSMDSDADKGDQSSGPSGDAVQSRTESSHIGDQPFETVKNQNDEVGVINKEAVDLHSNSDTDDGTSTGPGPEKAGGPVKTVAEENEAEAVNEAAALHIDSDTDVDEDDASLRSDKSQTAESELRGDGVSEGGDGSLDKVSESSVGNSGATEGTRAGTSNVPVECSEEETQKADSQGADYELMATQCYLEPQELESDLPDEEEATQAYILSSTWAEPDMFKRPSDPVGVLQISAVTLDKSEEEVDENAIAETQLFCLEADQSPGPSIKETPQLEEEVVDNQEETQPASSLEGSSKEAQESTQGTISQADTEPVSPHLSTRPPVGTGTWLHLKREVPTSIWMKGLQQGETSSMIKDSTQEDSTQDEVDLLPLELEATQSYILEDSNVQDHVPTLLALQKNDAKLDKSAVPETENPPRDTINLEPGVFAVPATESPPSGPSIPERDVSAVPSSESIPETGVPEVPANENPPTASSILETSVPEVAANESPPTVSSIPETGVPAVPANESPPTVSSIPETGVPEVAANENPLTASSIPDTGVPEVPANESPPTVSSIPETGVPAVPANESPPTASSILETCVSAVPLTEDPPTEQSKLELSVSAEPTTESLSKAMNNIETQVIDEDATQVCDLNLPVSDANIPQSNLDVPSPEDATQLCNLNVECTASNEAQSSAIPMLATEENTNLADIVKRKPATKRGLSRSRKKEQPENSTEVSTEKTQLPEQAAPATHSAPEETAALGASESEQSGPSIVASEKKKEIEPENSGRRRGGRRKAPEELESKTKTKDEMVVSIASGKSSDKVPSEVVPSTSGIKEVKRKQSNRKSAVKMQEDKKQDDTKEDFGSSTEKSKDSDVSEALSKNHPEKIECLKSKAEHVIEPTSIERSVDQVDNDQDRDITSRSVKPSGDKIVPTSSKNTESDESRILNLTDQSEAISAPQNKKPVRGKKRAATKTKQDNPQETASNDIEGKTESETSGTYLEKQGDFKIPTPTISDSQDGGQEGPSARRTRRSHTLTTQSSEQEKPKRSDTKVSQNEEANKTSPGDQNSGNTRSTRQRKNVQEAVKENSQIEVKTGRLTSKRALSSRGDQKNKEKNSQQTLEDKPDSSTLPKRTQKSSKEDMPEPEEVKEVEKTEEEKTVKQPRRTRKGYKEEQKTEDNDRSLEGSSTPEAQTTKRTRRGSKEQDIVVKEETVKETVTRKRRNSKADDTQLGEDQSKRSMRTRRVSKEEVVEEPTRDTSKEDTAGQNTPRRGRRTVKADGKIEHEHAGNLKPDKDISQSERSSSRTKKTSTEDSEKLLENTAANELSSHEETPRKGRTRTSAKEELPQVSTPMASRKRGQAAKSEVEPKRKKSDETQEVKEEKPAAKRGRPRKLSRTDDSQTSADGKEISTPEPSPSRSNRQRQSPALSNVAEVRTPRRTGRLSAAALTGSPCIAQSGAPIKVLFTGVVDAEGEEIIRSLGGDIADSVFDCTHLITDRVRRTVKFLCALARGIPIVTLNWIDKCKKSGCFLSHTKFLVKDTEQEKNFNFVLSASLQKAKKSLLFEGYDIHVTPSVKPDPDLMKDIICCSGATFLPKMPRTFKEKCVIVSCAEDAARCKSVPSRVPITTAEFILSGILRQEVKPEAYLLSSETEGSAPTPAKRRR